MASDTIIGIDLGTTNSEVAILSEGEPEVVREDAEALVPSCVGVDAAGSVIVGRQARNQWAAAPELRARRGGRVRHRQRVADAPGWSAVGPIHPRASSRTSRVISAPSTLFPTLHQ